MVGARDETGVRKRGAGMPPAGSHSNPARFLPRQAFGQCFPVQAFHDQERHALVMPDVVQRADVRMRQHRDSARLAVEALAHGWAGGIATEDDFDGNDAVEPRLTGAIHLAHPACAD